MANETRHLTYTVRHAPEYANARMVRECPGPIALTANGRCIRCGFPTVTTVTTPNGRPS